MSSYPDGWSSSNPKDPFYDRDDPYRVVKIHGLTAAAAATLLELAIPEVAESEARSGLLPEMTFHRTLVTGWARLAMTMSTNEDASRGKDLIDNAHHGQLYTRSPRLKAKIHTISYVTCAEHNRLYARHPLTPEQLDQGWKNGLRAARFIGIAEQHLPKSWSEARDSVFAEAERNGVIDDRMIALAKNALFWTGVARPLESVNLAVTANLLPRDFASRFGLFAEDHERVNRSFRLLTGVVTPLLDTTHIYDLVATAYVRLGMNLAPTKSADHSHSIGTASAGLA